ncbi:MAG TPA: hypothetical protein ENK43_12355, partial [Planctomycetes bacterium]|nr:hypothetical protein [Planctomycetota bacterium]
MLRAAIEPSSRASLQEASGIADRKHFRKRYLDPLVGAGWLEMRIPEKPTSPQRRYRTTEAGKVVLS